MDNKRNNKKKTREQHEDNTV